MLFVLNVKMDAKKVKPYERIIYPVYVAVMLLNTHIIYDPYFNNEGNPVDVFILVFIAYLLAIPQMFVTHYIQWRKNKNDPKATENLINQLLMWTAVSMLMPIAIIYLFLFIYENLSASFL